MPEPGRDACFLRKIPVTYSTRLNTVVKFTQSHRRELRARSSAKDSERGEVHIGQSRCLQGTALEAR